MKVPHLKINSEKGYTLLFAVIVSVLVLSIGAFILSVSRKEAILASSARDSIYAFYAADSGLECATENLSLLATSSYSSPSKISCGGNSIVFYPGNPGMGGANQVFGTSTFSMPNNGSGINSSQSGVSSCASTSVAYVYTPASGSLATSTIVTVTVRGYNIGYESSASGVDCNVPGPRKVERALQYTQYQ